MPPNARSQSDSRTKPRVSQLTNHSKIIKRSANHSGRIRLISWVPILPVIGQFTDDPRLSEANSSITEPEWLGENGEVPMAFSEIRVEINRSMHETEQRLTLQMNNIMGYVVDFRDGLETRLGKIDVRLNNIETHIGSTESSPLCQQINSGEQQPDEEEKKEDEEKVEE